MIPQPLDKRLRFALHALGLAIALATTEHAANAPVTVRIDANAGRHAISPNIYGVAYAPDAATLERLKFCQALTPGDFQQQRRQAKFSPPSSSGELLQRLAAMNARKTSYRRTPIGFTASL